MSTTCSVAQAIYERVCRVLNPMSSSPPPTAAWLWAPTPKTGLAAVFSIPSVRYELKKLLFPSEFASAKIALVLSGGAATASTAATIPFYSLGEYLDALHRDSLDVALWVFSSYSLGLQRRYITFGVKTALQLGREWEIVLSSLPRLFDAALRTRHAAVTQFVELYHGEDLFACGEPAYAGRVRAWLIAAAHACPPPGMFCAVTRLFARYAPVDTGTGTTKMLQTILESRPDEYGRRLLQKLRSDCQTLC